MSLTCQFCNKIFNTKSNLSRHQKTTKSCIKIQKSLNSDDKNEIIEITYDCSICDKKFTSKQILLSHNHSCPGIKIKEKYDNKNKITEEKYKKLLQEKDKLIFELESRNRELEEQMKIIRLEVEKEMYKERTEKLENTVEEMAKQPKQVTNNQNKIIITSSLDLSRESISETLENSFCNNYLIQGQKGVAKFAYENMLKDKDGRLIYVCTDPSRQIFQYKNDEGKYEKDVRATRLTQALLDADLKMTSHKVAWDTMKDGNNEVFMAYTTHFQNIQEMEQDNSQFSKELCCLTTK